MKKFFIPCVLAMFLFSCEKEQIENENYTAIPTEFQDEEISTDPYFISQSMAEQIASEIPYSFSEENSMNSKGLTSSNKKVKSILGAPDDMGSISFYIVNYQEGGFLILSADKRTNPVLAFSESDTFPTDPDYQYPTGLVEWSIGAKDYIKGIRESNQEMGEKQQLLWEPNNIGIAINLNKVVGKGSVSASKPSYCDDLHPDDLPYFPECEDCQDSFYTKGPLLETTWGQGVGYNDQAPYMGCSGYTNGRAPTGCVATAIAQIMNYHEKAGSFTSTFDWAAMPNHTGSSATSFLMAAIGSNIQMDYSCGGSSASMSYATGTLKNLYGYNHASLVGYGSDKVKQELNLNRPVILSGGRNDKWWIFNNYSDGHAWVCDGYRTSNICMESGGIFTYLFFYMNWGWGGSYNGWFGSDWSPGTNSYNYQKKMIYKLY